MNEFIFNTKSNAIQTILNKKHVFEQTIEKNVQVITECDEQSLYFSDNECTFTR